MDIPKVPRRLLSGILGMVLLAGAFGGTIIGAQGGNSYKSWKQTNHPWGAMELGESGESVSQSGCAITSAAMLMVHSGAVEDAGFDPSVLVEFMNENNGFDQAGNAQWWVMNHFDADFAFVNGRVLTGTQEQKTAEIRSLLEQGYYLMAQVNYGAHFVAIDGITQSGTVTMMDPASDAANLFVKYPADGVCQLRVFRGADVITVPEPTEAPTTEAATTEAATTAATTTEATTTTETTTTTEATTTTETTTTTEATTTAVTTEATTTTVQTTVKTTAATEAPVQTTVTTTVVAPALDAELFELDDQHLFITIKFTTTDNLNLRALAGTQNEILQVIPAGTVVTVVEVNRDFTWGKVAYNGYTGWVSLEYVNL